MSKAVLNESWRVDNRSTKEGSMERYTELLYWLQYKDMIHFDKKANEYYFDDDCPQRAIDSFKAWLKQFKQR